MRRRQGGRHDRGRRRHRRRVGPGFARRRGRRRGQPRAARVGTSPARPAGLDSRHEQESRTAGRHQEGCLHPGVGRVAQELAAARAVLRELADPPPRALDRRSTLYAGGGSAWYGASVWRSDDDGATWTQSSEGLTYGDDEPPKVTTIWNLTPSERHALRGRRAGRPVPQRRRRPDLEPRRRPARPPVAAGVAAGQRRAVPALDRAPSDRPRPHVGRHLGGRRVRDDRRRQDLGPAQQGRARRLLPGRPARIRPVRAQDAPASRPPRRAVPAEPLRRLPLRRRRPAVDRDHAATCPPTSASRWPSTRTTHRRST